MMTERFQLRNKMSGREPKGTWRQNGLIGGKPSYVTPTLSLAKRDAAESTRITVLAVCQSPVGNDVSTKSQEYSLLRAVTGQRLMKT